MKIHHRLLLVTGIALLLIAGSFFAGQTFADPMTGGNPPYEDVAPPCAVSCYIPPLRCPWYFRTDALGLRRDPYGRTTFATLDNPTDVAFSTSELDRQFRAGVQFLVGHTFGKSPWSIEGSYFMIDNWDTTAAVRNFNENASGTPGNLFSPFSNFGDPDTLVGFDENDLVSVQEKSWLQNGELNIKYLLPMPNVGFRASFITGVRYMNIEEQLFYHSESSEPAPGGSVVDFATRTTNNLIGPQIGGFFEIYSIYNCWITFEAKGAICGNTATQTTTDVAFDQFVQDERIVTAFVGDLQLMLNWRITPHIVTRLGYQAIWVDGLALASGNLGPAGTALAVGPPGVVPPIDAHGETVYHGPHIGLEITW